MTLKALIILVDGMWGPVHRSMRLPHLYAVTLPPSGILEEIKDTLKGLLPNKRRASSLVRTRRKNVYLLSMIFLAAASMQG